MLRGNLRWIRIPSRRGSNTPSRVQTLLTFFTANCSLSITPLIFVCKKILSYLQVGQESSSSSLKCLCNHLTAFGGDVLVAPNTIDFQLVQQAFDDLDPGDLLVLITVCFVFLAYFVVLVIARRADNVDVSKVCTEI